MEALAVLANSLQDGVSTDHVGLDKRPRIAQRIVVVAFGGEMHHDVIFSDQFVHQLSVANVAFYEIDLVSYRLQVGAIARIGELVDNSDVVFWLVFDGIMHKIRANESRTSRN